MNQTKEDLRAQIEGLKIQRDAYKNQVEALRPQLEKYEKLVRILREPNRYLDCGIKAMRIVVFGVTTTPPSLEEPQ